MSSKVQRGSLAGSLLTAFMASACCLGPLVLSFLGISSAGFLMRFEGYRSEFIAVAIVLLGVAGYFTYRKTPAQNCVTDAACVKPRSERLNKIVFWIAVVLVGLMIFYPTIEAHFGE